MPLFVEYAAGVALLATATNVVDPGLDWIPILYVSGVADLLVILIDFIKVDVVLGTV
jgi:hypothetical protein